MPAAVAASAASATTASDASLSITSAAISRIGKENRLKLRAFGDTITALVNKTRVVPEVVDPNPDELNGRNTLIVAGHGGSSGKGVEGSFRDVRIRLP